jgi:hypothetical protein
LNTSHSDRTDTIVTPVWARAVGNFTKFDAARQVQREFPEAIIIGAWLMEDADRKKGASPVFEVEWVDGDLETT